MAPKCPLLRPAGRNDRRIWLCRRRLRRCAVRRVGPRRATAPAPLLARMVGVGHLGRKTGRGSSSTPDRLQRTVVVRHLAPMAPSCGERRLGPPGWEAGVVSCAVSVWRVPVPTGREAWSSRLLKKAHLRTPILRMGTRVLGRSLRRTWSTPCSTLCPPPGIWTFLSSLGKSGFFRILLGHRTAGGGRG
jgi:hypothetical protein